VQDVSSLLELADPLERLLLASVLGAVLGFEREWRQRAAGLRTNTLIALGSALFTLVSIRMTAGGGDATRIPAQIVTGIGFLGGGAILRGSGDIRGLTTAATIWVNAAIGVAAGAGFFMLAIASTVAALVVLTLFVPIDKLLAEHHRRASLLDPGAANLHDGPPRADDSSAEP
jgi:putative Mg2+ transporter-C (MgtC) family protein